MKRILNFAMLCVVTMMVFGTLSTVSAAGQPETMSLVVKLVSGLTSVEQAAVVNRNGGVETSSIPALRLHVITVQTVDYPLTLQNYQSDPQVESVEANKTRKAEGVPGDPNYGVQWALSKIGWESVFGTVTPSGSAKIAILDTGIDALHPDLNGNIIPGTSILNGTNGLSDTNGHGTSLAGIVASLTDNGEGIAGIGYAGVHIMPVTVLGANGLGQDSDIIAGIIWAADQGADVILMGFSNPDFSQNLQDAIDYAWLKGAVMVAATGNDGVSTPTFPAGDRSVIGVSATDQYDALDAGSNYGQDVFLAAPGANIYTTTLGNSYTYISGTSASSAIVAGVAAFMKAVDPSLTNGIIVGRLGRSADYAGTLDDPNNQTMFGNGRVNIARALADTSTDSVQPAGTALTGSGGPFIGPYTAASKKFNLIFAGTGGGTISFSGFDHQTPPSCTGTCYKILLDNHDQGTLTVTPDTGSVFSGWSGSFNSPGWTSCSGTTTSCIIDIDKSTQTLTATFERQVVKTTPVITWGNPADITNGTALCATQLNATASVSGTISYSPVAGTVLDAGTHTLTANFTPTDATSYTTATKNVTIVATKATPVITWANPAGISYGTALSATQLNAAADVAGTFAYTPAAGVVLDAGTQSLKVDFTPTSSNYNAVSKTVSIDVTKATPVITWANPAGISYGTALSATQLNAAADVAGTFAYTPAAGVVLDAGTQSLKVDFTPTSSNYNAVSKTVSIDVTKATPVITWANPAVIGYGTALSATQLNAIADVAGTFVYTPAAGAVLDAGTQSLKVDFTPTGSNYNAVSKTVSIDVTKATPVITWANPAVIGYGTALSATQLNAIADVAGTFVYTPAAGAVLDAGTQSLKVDFTPTGSNYNAVSKTVSIDVTKATPVITWANPAVIGYGTALSATQLNAAADVAGTFVYTPAAGAILDAGTQSLKVDFTPTGSNYNAVSKTVSIDVTKATPVITWANPAVIGYGTALSATQLNAIADVAGTFVYTPAAGAVLDAGTQSLKVDFTPTGSNYNAVSKTVSIDVTKATPVITWANPAGISYGTALSATQLNAAADVAGTFAYTPAAGVVLDAGTQSLKVDFTPTSSNYNAVSKTVSIDVTKATPVITWANPAVIGYGTALSATQLNAIADVAGTFVYTPAAGTILDAGTQSLKVDFTPTDATKYSTASKTVSISITQIPCGAPASLTVPTTNSTGYVNVSWGTSTISGVTYILEQIFNGVTTQVYSGTATSKIITVTADGTYTYQVKATKNGYADSSFTTGTCVVTLKCSAPSSLSVPATNSTGYVNVSWGTSDVAGATYILEQNSGSGWTQVYSGTATSKIVTVTANGTYTYQVKAMKNGYAASDFTAGTANSCVVTLKCGAPSSLTVPATNSTGVLPISWGTSDVDGVTYILEQSISGGAFSQVYSGTATSKIITVTTNGTYTYQVKAMKSGYDTSNFTAGATNSCVVVLKCGMPSSLTVPATNSTGVLSISWGDSDVAGVTYILEQSISGGAFSQVYSGTAKNVNLNITTNGHYTYQVKAIKNGYDPSSSTAGNTNYCDVALKCGAPSSLTVPASNSTGVLPVSWGDSDVAGVTYILEQSFNGVTTQVYSGTAKNVNLNITTNGHYTYQVKATKTGYDPSSITAGNTNYCDVALKCGAPSSLTVPATNSSGVLPISWGDSDVAGVTYILEQSISGGAFSQVYSGTAKNVNLNITTNGHYTYQIKAIKNGYDPSFATAGNANYCDVALKCGVPASLTVPTTSSNGLVNVSWGASDVGGVTYILEQSINSGTFSQVYSGTATSKIVTVTVVGTYTYRVKATKASYADSDSSAPADCIVTIACGAPSSVTVPGNNSTGFVNVSWGASNVSGATYILEQSINGGTFSQVYSGTATSKIVTVTANGHYTYRVKATKTGFSESGYIETANYCDVILACGTPASLTVPATNNTGYVPVSWGVSDVSGVTYILEQSSNGVDYTPVYTGTATSKTLTLANGTYSYRVKATKANYADSSYKTSAVSCTVAKP